MKDLTVLSVTALIAAQAAASATVTGTGVNISQLEQDGTVLAVLDSTAGGSGATLAVKLQSSATQGGTYADITGAAFTQVGNAASVQEIGVKLRSVPNPWVRALCTIGGTATFSFVVHLIAPPKYA